MKRSTSDTSEMSPKKKMSMKRQNLAKPFPNLVKAFLENTLIFDVMEVCKGPPHRPRNWHPFHSIILKGTYSSKKQLEENEVEKLKHIVPNFDLEFKQDPVVNNNSFINRTKFNDKTKGSYCPGIVTDSKYLKNC